ncbi:hypothetical protein GCM10008090_10190 [Arenicella chitinivorans]|uniref:Uncharacterized protein n=1 Tax=Arenicella chitinivorans TaxID=1329800 RepID=A0A918RKQ7_9GAMM|nr:hypothetical protein [Arenicella chitinivorans]GHA03178.1 hypothetical protein GCM10008090_10190 [Arenicella chitinivorans]
MNRKVPLWLFLLSLVLVFTGFGLWGKSNIDSYDREYGLHARDYYSKVSVLEHLNRNEVEEAKKILKEETEAIGMAIAVCLMNRCSLEVEKVRDEYRNR